MHGSSLSGVGSLRGPVPQAPGIYRVEASPKGKEGGRDELKPPVLGEGVNGVGHGVADPGHGAKGIGAGTQMGNLTEEFRGVAFLLKGISLGV